MTQVQTETDDLPLEVLQSSEQTKQVTTQGHGPCHGPGVIHELIINKSLLQESTRTRMRCVCVCACGYVYVKRMEK